MTNSIYGISNPYSNAYATNYLQNAYGNNYSTNSLAFATQPQYDTFEKKEGSVVGSIAKGSLVVAGLTAVGLGIASLVTKKNQFKNVWNKLFSKGAVEGGKQGGKGLSSTKEIIESYLPKAEAERLSALKRLRNDALTLQLKSHLEKCGVTLNDDFYKALKDAKSPADVQNVVKQFIEKARKANPSAKFETLSENVLGDWANATANCNKEFKPYRAIVANSQKHANAIAQRNADLANISGGELKKAIDALGKDKADEIYKLADEGNIGNLQTKIQESIPDYQTKGTLHLSDWANSSKQAAETTTKKLDSGKIAELAQAKTKANQIYENLDAEAKKAFDLCVKKGESSSLPAYEEQVTIIKKLLGINL